MVLLSVVVLLMLGGFGGGSKTELFLSHAFIRTTVTTHPMIEATSVQVMNATRRTVVERTPWIVGSGRGVRRNCLNEDGRDVVD